MANEFKTLGGYAVKDATAREQIAALTQKHNTDISTLSQQVDTKLAEVQTGFESEMNSFKDEVNTSTAAMAQAFNAALDAQSQKHDDDINNITEMISGMPDGDYVTPHMFGAVGDGVTNDTAAFMSMFAADNGVIVIPDGVYLIDGDIRVYSNTRVFLSPKATIKRIFTGVYTQPVFVFGENGSDTFASGYNGVHDVFIHGGTIDMGATVAMDINEHGGATMAIGHCRNIIIDGVTFKNGANDHYIEVNGSKDIIIKNCLFDKPVITGSANYEAINIDYANSDGFPCYGYYDNTHNENLLIENCVFNNCDKAIGNHSKLDDNYHKNIIIRNCKDYNSLRCFVHLWNGHNVLIDNCYITGNKNVDEATIFFTGSKNIKVTNTYIDNCYGNSIAFHTAGDYFCEEIHTENNTIKNIVESGAGAIYYRNVNRGYIINNIIDNVEDAGIAMHTATNLIVKGNIIKNHKATNYAPIDCFGNVNDSEFTQNVSLNHTGHEAFFKCPSGSNNHFYNNKINDCPKLIIPDNAKVNNYINGYKRIVNGNYVSGNTMALTTPISKFDELLISCGTASSYEWHTAKCHNSRESFAAGSDGIEFVSTGGNVHITITDDTTLTLDTCGTKNIREIHGKLK